MNEFEHENVAPNDEENTSLDTQRIAAFDKLVEWFIEFDPFEIKMFVENFRDRHPNLSDDELAKRLIDLKAVKNGLVGAATGVPGFFAFPVTIPTDLVMSWKIQINLALCMAYIYGHNIDEMDPDDLKADIYIILSGDKAKTHLRVFGIDIDNVSQKSLKRYMNRELTSEVWKYIGRQIAITSGGRSAAKLSKMIPLLGAPIGFAFDYQATRAVGAFARKYYSGRGTIIDAQAN